MHENENIEKDFNDDPIVMVVAAGESTTIEDHPPIITVITISKQNKIKWRVFENRLIKGKVQHIELHTEKKYCVALIMV